MNTFNPVKSMPEVFSTRICDLSRARRDSVYARYAAAIKGKFGCDVSFSGDKTSGLIMTWNAKNTPMDQAERAANYTWQVLTMY